MQEVEVVLRAKLMKNLISYPKISSTIEKKILTLKNKVTDLTIIRRLESAKK